MKNLIFILLVFISAQLFSQGQIDFQEVRVRYYFIWDNVENRHAASADSIMGFDYGNDTAIKIPYSFGGYWSKTGNYVYPANLNDSIAVGVNTPVYKFYVNGSMGSAYDTTNRTYFLCSDSSGGIISLMDTARFASSDTSFFDLAGAVLSPKSAIDTLDLTFVLADTLGVGLSAPDSLLDIYGGGQFKTDILVGGGWDVWYPTLTWAGGQPTISDTVYRYEVVNNTVTFKIQLKASNSSGSETTDFEMTLPITPKDVNAKIAVTDYTAFNGATFARNWYCYVDAITDADGSRKLYTAGVVSIPNGNYYELWISGCYEITGR
jgi:hypothetical protein